MLPSVQLDKIKQQCWSLCKKLGVSDYARLDFRLSEDHAYYLLDLNAIPYLGPQGSFARAFAQRGIEFDDMVSFILKESFQRWNISESLIDGKR